MAEGFSSETIGFLIELRMRNDRAWYNEHKPDYERLVLRPFQALVSALAPTIARIDPLIDTTPAVGKTISRIYRDSRFSSDKSFYRDRAWITFERKIKEEGYDVPAFYFELTPSGYSYGAGYYYVSVKTMDNFRAMIDRDAEAFLKIVEPIAKNGALAAHGDMYKRSRYTGADARIAEWYNRKNLYVAAGFDGVSDAFCFGGLVSRLEDGFAALAGIYHFMCGAAFDEAAR